jgi:hypothetical protein
MLRRKPHYLILAWRKLKWQRNRPVTASANDSRLQTAWGLIPRPPNLAVQTSSTTCVGE